LTGAAEASLVGTEEDEEDADEEADDDADDDAQRVV
jgi:hypothetical protein